MSAATIRLEEVVSRKQLRTFIHLPAQLADRRANYVPPIWADEVAFHDPKKNPGLADCDVVRFLAWHGDRCVGRVMGIIHNTYNTRNGERTARFYQLDVTDDKLVTAALIGTVEHWARARGMDRVIGPFGLSDKDPQGVQVEGFEHLPILATPTNPPFLPRYIEALGYAKLADAVVYKLPIPAELPAVYHAIAARLTRSGELRVVPFTSRKQLRPWILPVLRLVNVTYQDLLGFVPMTEAEMTKLAAQYMPVLDPAFVKVVADRANEPVAFVVAMPDMSKGMQKANGRVFPFGFIHLLLAMRRAKQLDLFLGAVRPDLQGRGLTCLLGVELMRTAKERGFTHIDSHLVLESNMRMRAEVERLGGWIWKRYRVFGKHLR